MFMNSENSKTSDPHRLLQNLTQPEIINILPYQILAFTVHGKR